MENQYTLKSIAEFDHSLLLKLYRTNSKLRRLINRNDQMRSIVFKDLAKKYCTYELTTNNIDNYLHILYSHEFDAQIPSDMRYLLGIDFSSIMWHIPTLDEMCNAITSEIDFTSISRAELIDYISKYGETLPILIRTFNIFRDIDEEYSNNNPDMNLIRYYRDLDITSEIQLSEILTFLLFLFKKYNNLEYTDPDSDFHVNIDRNLIVDTISELLSKGANPLKKSVFSSQGDMFSEYEYEYELENALDILISIPNFWNFFTENMVKLSYRRIVNITAEYLPEDIKERFIEQTNFRLELHRNEYSELEMDLYGSD